MCSIQANMNILTKHISLLGNILHKYYYIHDLLILKAYFIKQNVPVI